MNILPWCRSLALTLACLLLRLQQIMTLHAKGPPTVALNVETVKGGNGISNGVGQLSLWCQAVDGQSKRPVPIKSATFSYGAQRFDAKLTDNAHNASLVREKSPAVETGTWRCNLQTTYGNTSGNIMVHVRPVIYSNTTIRIDEKEGSKTLFEAASLTITRGDKAELKCPVYGNPKPEIIWRTANSKQIQGSGDTFTITSVDDKDDNTYSCTATNTIYLNGARQKFELVVERRLRIKSEYAWLIPLTVILLIITLLILTIVFCECHKRGQEQKPIILDEE